MESGHVPLRASYGDVGPLLADLYATFALKACEREVEYLLNVPTEPVQLYFDRSKLEIILTNLLANAFTYTRTKGRVELIVSVVGSPSAEAVFAGEQLAGNYLKVSVSDTGVGIAPHELDRIFDPYYQATHTSTLRLGGTGIGLALAQQFARRHGGQLTVASTQHVGTTFELRLPFGCQHLQPEDIQASTLAEPTAVVEATLSPLKNLTLPAPETPPLATLPRLLVVEDNDEVRDYLRQLFAADYQVTVAEDGVAGWEHALTQLPDLIISDVMMPRSDGLELCQRLKQHPKTSHIPVVLLTAPTAETH